MNGKDNYRVEQHETYEDLEQLVERGRKLHSQAIYETFAGIIARVQSAWREWALFSNRSHNLKHP